MTNSLFEAKEMALNHYKMIEAENSVKHPGGGMVREPYSRVATPLAIGKKCIACDGESTIIVPPTFEGDTSSFLFSIERKGIQYFIELK